MEFRFDLNELFKQPIVEVGNTLIPPGFTGDKRALWDTQSKMTQIVNAIGEASARAQGLSKPITTADRLRNSEHRLYLLMDPSANNGKGAVTGMLKTGSKGLYVFDRNGQHYQVSPQCVLDFYIHESRQRTGLGRRLFEHMLQMQQIEPEKMAIDRPSDKFLGFLSKHYGLNTPVKQMNNYVVYDGFFPKGPETSQHVVADKSNPPSKKQSANGLQQGHLPSQTYGRYGAAQRPCSMGQIIHNDSAVIHRKQEPTGVRSEPITNLHGHANYQHGQRNQAVWQSSPSVPAHYPYSGYSQAQGDRSDALVKQPLIPQAFDGTLRTGTHALHGSLSAPQTHFAQRVQIAEQPASTWGGECQQIGPAAAQIQGWAPQSAIQVAPVQMIGRGYQAPPSSQMVHQNIQSSVPQVGSNQPIDTGPYETTPSGQMAQQSFQSSGPEVGSYQPIPIHASQSATPMSQMVPQEVQSSVPQVGANQPIGLYNSQSATPIGHAYQAPPASHMAQQDFQSSTPQVGANQPIGLYNSQSATPIGHAYQAPFSSHMAQQDFQSSTPQVGANQPIGLHNSQSATPIGHPYQASPSSQIAQENVQIHPYQGQGYQFPPQLANQSSLQRPVGLEQPQSGTQLVPEGSHHHQAPPCESGSFAHLGGVSNIQPPAPAPLGLEFASNESPQTVPVTVPQESSGGQVAGGQFMENPPEFQNVNPARYLDQEVDLSRGYPPQHLQSPAPARPPIIIRN